MHSNRYKSKPVQLFGTERVSDRANHHNHPGGTAQESDADRTFRNIVRGVTRQNVMFYIYTTGTGPIDYTHNKK